MLNEISWMSWGTAVTRTHSKNSGFLGIKKWEMQTTDWPFLVISSSISQGQKCQNSGAESWLRIKWRDHKTVNLCRACDVPQTAALFINMFQSDVTELQIEITKHSRWHNVKIICKYLETFWHSSILQIIALTTNSFTGSSYPYDAVSSSLKQSKSKCKSKLQHSSEKLSPSCRSSYVLNSKHSGGEKAVWSTSSVVRWLTSYLLTL